MTQALWSETKKHTVKVEGATCEIVLKHIGDPTNARKFRSKQNEWLRINEKMRMDVRKDLLARYGNAGSAVEAIIPGWESPTFSQAIDVAMRRTQEWVDALDERTHWFIKEGTADGDAAFSALWNAGGEQMLLAALHDIIIHNDPSLAPPVNAEGEPSTGES